MADDSYESEPSPDAGERPYFEGFYAVAYSALRNGAREYLGPGEEIVDLGCGNGSVAKMVNQLVSGCHVVCVDSDEAALAELRKRQSSILESGRTKLDLINADANEYLRSLDNAQVDWITLNSSLHEFCGDDKAKYLDSFFSYAKAALAKPFGKLLIGDYYYKDGADPKAVAEFMKYQQEIIHHADAPDKFVKPELVAAKAKEHGLTELHHVEVPVAKPEVGRIYYLYIFAV